MLVDHPEELMPVSSHVSVKYTPPGKLGFDEVQLCKLSQYTGDSFSLQLQFSLEEK